MRTYLLAILSCVVMASCKSLPAHQSKKPSKEVVYSSYNSAYQLAWQVENDQEFMTIHISTNYKPTQFKILRKGLTVAFNKDLKKRPDQAFMYPVRQKGSGRGRDMEQRAGSGRQGGNRGQGRKMDLQKMVDRVPSNVILNRDNGQDSFSVYTLPEGFDVSLDASSEVLKLTYKLPLKEIYGSTDFSDPIAVGLISGSFDIPVATNAGNTGGRPSGASPNRNMAELADPVKIWFKVLPAKNS